MAAGIGDHLPIGFIEQRAVNIFVIWSLEAGLVQRFQIAINKVDDNRSAHRTRQLPALQIHLRVERQNQQLVTRGEILEGNRVMSCGNRLRGPTPRSKQTARGAPIPASR